MKRISSLFATLLLGAFSASAMAGTPGVVQATTPGSLTTVLVNVYSGAVTFCTATVLNGGPLAVCKSVATLNVNGVTQASDIEILTPNQSLLGVVSYTNFQITNRVNGIFLMCSTSVDGLSGLNASCKESAV